MKYTRKLIGSSVAVALIASLAIPAASAFAVPTAASKQAEAQAALASLNTMQKNLDEAENKHWVALQEKEEAESKRDEAETKLNEANAKIGKLQNKLGSRARNMYRSGSASALDVLFGSTSFKEFATNWDLLNQMNQQDAQLVSETKALRETIETSKREYAEQARLASEKEEEARKVASEAQSTVDSMQRTYNSLSSEASQLLEQERAAQTAAAVANAQQAVNQAASSARPSTSSGSKGSSKPAPEYSTSTGNAIVDRARSALGKPYVWGATGPNGYDCSGLVGFALTGTHKRIGVAATFTGYPRVSNPQPGDIAANSTHCGIYIGNGQMIHAATFGVGVIIGPVQKGMVITRA